MERERRDHGRPVAGSRLRHAEDVPQDVRPRSVRPHDFVQDSVLGRLAVAGLCERHEAGRLEDRHVRAGHRRPGASVHQLGGRPRQRIDRRVRRLRRRRATNLAAKPTRFTKHANAAGGTAYFTSAPTAAALKSHPGRGAARARRRLGAESPSDRRQLVVHSQGAGRPRGVLLRQLLGHGGRDPRAAPRTHAARSGGIPTPGRSRRRSSPTRPTTASRSPACKLALPPVRSCFLIGTKPAAAPRLRRYLHL